jgi:hypothetical protein
MMGELLGKRSGLAHQTRNSLSQRVVETLDMMGFAGQLADGSMLCRRHDTFVHHLLIRVQHGVLALCSRNLGPQALGTLAAAIPAMEGHHLTRLGIHGDPDPLRVRLLVDKTGHFIRFHLQALDHDVLMAHDGLDIHMVRSGLKAGDEKAQEPLESDTHRATNATPGNPLHQ